MKKLIINYDGAGGYRKASKYLTKKHGPAFSIIVDAITYIYNENRDNLIDIKNEKAVKISNGYLSRHTGLGIDTIKRQIKKIESVGLVAAIKKGQGNTRHYVIYIDRINEYIQALGIEFKDWFKKSLDASKKDISRSKEADQFKLKKSMEVYEEALAGIKTNNAKPANELAQNPPTQQGNTTIPNSVKPTVVDTNKYTVIDTTTNKEATKMIHVVDKVFIEKDNDGAYIFIEDYKKKIYKREYVDYIKKYSDEELNNIFDNIPLHIDVDEDIESLLDDNINESNLTSDIKKAREISNEEIIKYIYDEYKRLERRNKWMKEKERQITKEPASKEISDLNWNILKDAYADLPDIPNQGKFYPSKEDKENFYTLSEYRQEYVISCVTDKKHLSTTASRPAVYIEEAMKERLNENINSENRQHIAL